MNGKGSGISLVGPKATVEKGPIIEYGRKPSRKPEGAGSPEAWREHCCQTSRTSTMMPKHCFLGFLVSFLLTGGEGIPPAHDSLKPQRVQFRSRNFHNILHWQPGRTLTGNSSTYFVQYKMYGQRQWQNKEDCWGIQELFCDLTNETSDLQEPYYGREQQVYEGARGVAEIEALTPHSGYCVVAEIYLPLLDRSSQRSEERCVGTP
ncbi:Interleukin-22 receptor subunit alpha-2 [Sciurus carolinensis]|uniref:Interleukin-22 receptor subunit alpha-2 n=1 Tax=Sciurus carolinensis TaxID=30640 RepID=A0AA41N6U4_SCICA|nr:Interleukin-22 receptor subunit alpha-2 [Sciurus carolinensis]